MIKKLAILLLAFLFIVPAFFYIITTSYSQSITLSEKKVIYDLPYAGILPDNPFYILKQMRDIVIELSTRDQMKKAEILLLSSDKKIHMALLLAKKGKSKLMIDTLTQAEEQSLRIPGLITSSKKQGVGPKEGFVYRLKLSNVKHREVIEELIKNLPQGKEKEMGIIFDLNNKIRKQLDTL
ncbi:hypothetical protein A2334_01420 [Candidatus Roizmanbacteria bacterium RIFOXYB2_FULL_38_10]|uniref:DUF5667 domain-containing protein n=1 Tax=Candidatus Roizmanbacteria bacterium RIFOXYD1_FULL_38_12 TaxID=1802093 RepID=A0A1F7L2A2_9BACT|nr:MAG: hypothetical protein A3K47_05640 [Candidatus Roizmanbacteria bacterium RIFOXYA2_FULL_38_14]OGK64226.1 MAG: hypothetical protein A3K27_05640 [Candidatus Roizmanbacteria bacterium RIFOXYA1_FULL_37_12]OGK66072.1 MAG: hypothetical protein A3K38_05640 [Candidatus Roizmanbacteria bacterium RIFOXYB1_FULL_40_23]OGK68509.1 MAG: hypothetical protein A2334_01420 [Candidatus Roizmanbacteria bacterium RIFOXYB2_FULL_38_10]OGK70477.1 MAG: hypothetical protein A3K21_05645 [Candidatus Roizmanbacteria ba